MGSWARPHLIPGCDSEKDPLESSIECTVTLCVEWVVNGWPGPCRGAGRAVGGGRCVLLQPIQTVPQRESGSSGRPELEELQDGHSRALNPRHRPLNRQQDFSGHETPKDCTSCKAVKQTLNARYILLRKILYSYTVVFSLFPLNGLFLLLSLLTSLYTCCSKVKTSVLVHLKQRLVLGFLLSRWVIEHLAIFMVVVQSLNHVRLCIPMDCSMPGFPVPHHLLEFAKIMSIESVMLSNHLRCRRTQIPVVL